MARGCCEFEFENSIPSLDLIVSQVTKLTGLNVIVNNIYDEEENLINAEIAFNEFPESFLEIELEERCPQDDVEKFNINENQPIIRSHISDSNESKYMISIIGFISQERTLFEAIRSSLYEFGGKQKHSENYKELGRIKFPVDVKELQDRHKRHKIISNIKLFLTVLFSPFLLVINIFMTFIIMIKSFYKK